MKRLVNKLKTVAQGLMVLLTLIIVLITKPFKSYPFLKIILINILIIPFSLWSFKNILGLPQDWVFVSCYFILINLNLFLKTSLRKVNLWWLSLISLGYLTINSFNCFELINLTWATIINLSLLKVSVLTWLWIIINVGVLKHKLKNPKIKPPQKTKVQEEREVLNNWHQQRVLVNPLQMQGFFIRVVFLIVVIGFIAIMYKGCSMQIQHVKNNIENCECDQ